MLLAVLVAWAIGVWAAFTFGRLVTMATDVNVGLAVLIGTNLLFSSWVWWRATPGSGDAMVLPSLVLILAAMLIGILPRVLWPANDGSHMVGSTASAVIMTFIAVVQIRKLRRLGDRARAVTRVEDGPTG